MSFWSWLTGRDDIKEKSVVANFPLVEQVSTEIKTIGTTGVGNAQDAIYAALDALNSVKGMEYVGSITVSNYDSVFSSITDMINGVAEQLEGKADDIKTYQESSFLEKVGSTFCMGAAKLGEGLLSVVEDIGDGVVSIVGFGAGLLGAKDFQQDCVNFMNKEWSHDAFNFYYESDFAKKSAITEDSAAASALKITGKVAGYIWGGYLAAGAMGLSAAGTYGVGLLTANGVTWGGTLVAGLATMGTSMEGSIRTAAANGEEFNYNAAFGKALGDGGKAAALTFVMAKGADKLSTTLNSRAATKLAKVADKTDETLNGGQKGVKLLKEAADKSDEMARVADHLDEMSEGAKKTVEATKKAAGSLDEITEGTRKGVVGRLKDIPGKIKDIPGKIKEIPGKVAAIPGKVAAIPGKVADAAVHSIQTIGANGLPQVTAPGVAGAVVTTATTGGGADTRLTDFQVDAGTIKGASREAVVDTYGEFVERANAISNYNGGNTGTNTSSSLFEDTQLAEIVRPDILTENPPGGQTPTGSGPTGSGPIGGGPIGSTPDIPTIDTTPLDTSPTTIPSVEPSTIAPPTNSPFTSSPTTTSPFVSPINPTGPGTGTTTHGGGGYGETGYTGEDGTELMGASLSELLDDSDSSIDEIIKGSKYSRIPTSSKPILNSDTVSSASVIPLAAGLSVASAAGLAAKAYIDHKKATEEEEEEEDGEEYEYGQYDDINVDNWSASDEDIAAAQIEVGEDEFVNVDRQDDDEYYRVMDNPLPVMGVDELEEY